MMNEPEWTEHPLTNKLEWISDPGHAWLKVPKDAYAESQTHASACSYEHDGFVYLEEDCDAPRFLEAMNLSHWYIPTRRYPEQRQNDDVHPRQMAPLVDPEYVNPFAVPSGAAIDEPTCPHGQLFVCIDCRNDGHAEPLIDPVATTAKADQKFLDDHFQIVVVS